MVDRDAIRPSHGEFEIDGDALEDQADAAVRQELLPRRLVPGVEVLPDVSCPVAAAALGEPHVHDVVDVAHRVLLAPDDALPMEACALLVRQIPFAAGDEVAPVRPEHLKDFARLVHQRRRHAKRYTFPYPCFGVAQPSWRYREFRFLGLGHRCCRITSNGDGIVASQGQLSGYAPDRTLEYHIRFTMSC